MKSAAVPLSPAVHGRLAAGHVGVAAGAAAGRRRAQISILRDTETELLFKDISRPLIKAAGLDPNSVTVVLLNDPEINAFVATGQTVYIQSGLLIAADNANQLQGVIAHELGHIAGGHSIRIQRGREARRPRSASRP